LGTAFAKSNFNFDRIKVGSEIGGLSSQCSKKYLLEGKKFNLMGFKY
jgi:hypothetical protein